MKLLAKLRRSHTPDIEALSALADGALDAASARSFEAHIDACDACAQALEGLRQVRSMVSAMPEADVPRSFRLRRADVAAARRAEAQSSPLRWAPALSGVAAALFVAVLVADVSNSGGDGDVTLESFEAAGPPPAPGGFGGIAADSADSPAAPTQAPAAGASAPTTEDADGSESGASDDAARIEPCPPGATPSTNAFDACIPDSASAYRVNTAERIEAERTRQAELQAQAVTGDDDDDGGNRTAFLVVEIIAASVAVGAAVTYFATRGRARAQ